MVAVLGCQRVNHEQLLKKQKQIQVLGELRPFNVNHRKTANAGNLAAVCERQFQLITSLPSALQEGFSIIVIFKDKIEFFVDIALNVNVAASVLLQAYPEQKEDIRMAIQSYLSEETSIAGELSRVFDDPQGKIPEEYCSLGLGCHFLPKCRYGLHFPLCKIDSCEYSLPLHQEITCVKVPPSYVLLMRDKCFRDLVLLPRANQERVPHTNDQLIKNEASWKVVLNCANDLANKLGLETHKCYVNLHCNFGKWESFVARNPGAFGCHAHIHLFLTREAAIALGKMEPAFRGFLDVPDDHHLGDCDKLRRRTEMTDVEKLRTDVTMIQTDVTDIKNQMTEILRLLKQKPGV